MGAGTSRFIELLAEEYPSVADVSRAIALGKHALTFPKPTELFLSDIHGEYEAFAHIVRNGCGSLKPHIGDAFGDVLSDEEKETLATLVCYPAEKAQADIDDYANEATYYGEAIAELLVLLNHLSQFHPYDRVLDLLPEDIGEAIEELLSQTRLHVAGCVSRESLDALANSIIIASFIKTGSALYLIETLGKTIQDLLVTSIHVVGDIYDRGPAPDLIMEEMINHPHIDVQWGNHDIVWMGAALGQRGCIAHVVRNCARYGNLSILTDGYGINIIPLANFALSAYADDPCEGYALKGNPQLSPQETDLNIKIQKAMAILQFKVEAQLIDENPSFNLESRKLLHTINRETNTIIIDGVEYDVKDPVFPTVNWDDPYALTDEEEYVMTSLEKAFQNCEKLQRHIRFFLDRGSLYKIKNNTLMLHACVPLNDDGTLKEVDIYGKTYKGRELFEAVDRYVRAAFSATDAQSRKRGCDLLWYLWLGEGSPLFAKSKMATFEIYLIEDKAARKEIKNSYYSLLENKEVMYTIFEDFGMDPEVSRIVCGHTPVKVKDGEDPVKCNGRIVVIDGGFSSAYQSTTGIAGFTLVSNEKGVALVTHQPFEGKQAALDHNADVHSARRILEAAAQPRTFASTDEGAQLKLYLTDLEDLLSYYQH